jgi:hypothetical protein
MADDNTTDSHNQPGEQTTGDEFRNYDLKANAREAQEPTVRFAFDFPELLAAFETADAIAGKSRDRNRRIGIAGILLVLAALLYASTAPILQPSLNPETFVALGSLAAVAGLVGTGLGVMGLMRKSQRHAWLEARLTTELLRLFHFRYIAANVDQILAAATDTERQAEYRTARRAAFETLRAKLKEPKAAFDAVIRQDGPDPLEWVVERPIAGDASAAGDLFAAWMVLRLNWQLGYCRAKLADRSTGGKLSPVQQEHVFTALGWGCLSVVVIFHIFHLFWHWGWLETAVVWAALMALALRATEDGLKPQREVERYEQYRVGIDVAIQRFLPSDDLRTRVEVMRNFERVSTQEMRTFLRTHATARYLL